MKKLIEITWFHPDGWIPDWRVVPQDELLSEEQCRYGYPKGRYFLVDESVLERIKETKQKVEQLLCQAREVSQLAQDAWGANFLVSTWLVWPENRCQAYTKKGNRCKNPKKKDTDHCGVHQETDYLVLAQDNWEGIDIGDYLVWNNLKPSLVEKIEATEIEPRRGQSWEELFAQYESDNK